MGGRPFTHALLSVVFHRRPARLVQGKGAGLLPSTSAHSAGCGASPSGWYGWGLPGLKEARMARLPGGMCTALGPVPPPEPQLSLLITSTITAQRARALNAAAMRLASSATSRARWDDVLSPISHLPYRTSGAFQRRLPPGGSGWDNSQCSATSWTAAWIHDISRTGSRDRPSASVTTTADSAVRTRDADTAAAPDFGCPSGRDWPWRAVQRGAVALHHPRPRSACRL